MYSYHVVWYVYLLRSLQTTYEMLQILLGQCFIRQVLTENNPLCCFSIVVASRHE